MYYYKILKYFYTTFPARLMPQNTIYVKEVEVENFTAHLNQITNYHEI